MERSSSSDDITGWFEEVATNAEKVQMEILKRILEMNHGAEYLKKWLGDIDVENMDAHVLQSLYVSMVPLASHVDLEPYIQRIADGDTSPLLTKQPITTLSLSSGTTEGRQKYVPFTTHSSTTTLQIFKLAAAYRSRVYPTREGGRILEFIYGSKQFKTKGGLSAGTATTHYFASREFRIRQEETKSFTCSPQEVIFSGDYKQSTYCHFLLGLFYSPQVEFITSTFAFGVVQALTLFEDYWRDLCSDLSNGTLSQRIITIPSIRKSVLDLIEPNESLAAWITSKCEELEGSGWHGLIPKLWPNAKYVCSIMTGSMQPYLEKLRHYAGDHLPLVCADYGSTESWIGVNMDPCSAPEKVTFTLVPSFAFFEFIPLYRPNHQPPKACDHTVAVAGGTGDNYLEDDPVPLSQVKIGQQYEIVLTTFTGLYRYRLGDVVEVAGFFKGTPKLNFLWRRKLILTVNIDKNTENDLQLAVQKGSQPLINSGAELVDFTSHANIVNQPGHYVVYWEIKGEVSEHILGQCCKEMDAAFVDHGYVVARKTNSIGPLELCVVERGTFKKIMEYFIGNGATMSQFKTPRCTTNQVLLRILNLCTVKRLRSTAYH
uniref:indole-3-acetic acid-amido synthetase GH3.10 n=1 Tax=Erigeron canadensis TaxID=72917 RepID=UPI001CB94798|nr:indole-3-acetic acid-amido synthetase GH3.10 [Erigeron canadensis]XP_043608134.1 indole-3-acetic acid-amido synthetase GH3.10 [Erigeron canadensis]XP_043608135.1 indole-3-acetic acid-amido synthetase GH3.10 [Erigeron canadensis]